MAGTANWTMSWKMDGFDQLLYFYEIKLDYFHDSYFDL